MKMRTLRSTVAITLLLACSMGMLNATAETPLPPAPATGWCFDSFSTPNYNGVKACPTAIPPQPGVCAPGRQSTASVCYTYTTRGTTCRVGSDITSFEQVFGRNSTLPPKPGDPITVAFPGLNYFAVIANMPGSGYIALKFHTPPAWAPNQIGILTHGETLPGPSITATISEHCGDFTPANAQCGPVPGRGPGQIAAKWRADSYTASNGCPLRPNTDYYENVRVTDPSMCGPACIVTLSNNHTP